MALPDVSLSFEWHIQHAKSKLKALITNLQSNIENRSIRFKLIVYSDYCDIPRQFNQDIMHGQNAACQTFEWTNSPDQTQSDIDAVSVLDGGDFPEAVELMLEQAHSSDFRNDAQKLILWMLDAPAHMYYDGEDYYPKVDKLPMSGKLQRKPSVALSLQALKNQQVAVYSMVFGRDAQAKCFAYMASRLTNSTYTDLDNAQSTHSFIDLILHKVKIEAIAQSLIEQVMSFLGQHNLTIDIKEKQVSDAINSHPELIKVAGNASVFSTITFEEPSTHEGFFDRPIPDEVSLQQFFRLLSRNNTRPSPSQPSVVLSSDHEIVYRGLRGLGSSIDSGSHRAGYRSLSNLGSSLDNDDDNSNTYSPPVSARITKRMVMGTGNSHGNADKLRKTEPEHPSSLASSSLASSSIFPPHH